MAAGDGGVLGNGSKIGYQTVVSPLGSWNKIGQVMEVGGLTLTVETWDSTVHSANSFAREAPGLITVAPLVLKVLTNPNPAAGEGIIQDALYDLMISKETIAWRVEVPANRDKTLFKGREFEGFVSSYEEEQPIRDGQVVTINITFDATTINRDQTAAVSEMS